MNLEQLKIISTLIYRKLCLLPEFNAFISKLDITDFINNPYGDELSILIRKTITEFMFKDLSHSEILKIDSYCRLEILIKKYRTQPSTDGTGQLIKPQFTADKLVNLALKIYDIDFLLQNEIQFLYDIILFHHAENIPVSNQLVAYIHKTPQLSFVFLCIILHENIDINIFIPALINEHNIMQMRGKNGETLLHFAIKHIGYIKDLQNIKALISRFPSLLQARDNKENNIFFYLESSYFGDAIDVNFVKELIALLAAKNNDINHLNAQGNSAFYHLARNTKIAQNIVNSSIILHELFNYGALYIRNHKQDKSPLHLAVALNSIFNIQDVQKFAKNGINAIDDEHKTALHHAVILNKDFCAIQLLAAGARFDIQDKYLHTALDYAILAGNTLIVKQMLTLNHKRKYHNMQKTSRYTSKIILACLSRSFKMYELVKTRFEPETAIDQAIIAMIDADKIQEDVIKKYTYEQQLVILSAILRIKSNLTADAKAYIKAARKKLFPNPELIHNNAGIAYGLELEASNISPALPLEFPWFKVSSERDPSVINTLFMNPLQLQNEEQTEIVSSIITHKDELKCFLSLAEEIEASGGIVNPSTGFHVHTNIKGGSSNGKTVPSIMLPFMRENYTLEQLEIMLTKQIVINFAHLEPLLQGILRGGRLYDYQDLNAHIYTALISSLVPLLVQCKTFEDMFEVLEHNRFKSINLLSIDEHGTIEFRMHEGASNPIIINAWLNFVHRLLAMSLEQIEARLQANKSLDAPFEAYPEIETLIYILMAEREYQKTWCAERGATCNTDIDAAPSVTWSLAAKALKKPTPIQVDIQNSLLYRLFLKAKSNQEFLNEFYTHKASADKHLVNDLEKMIKLVAKFPGPLDNKIDMENFEYQINGMRLGLVFNPSHRGIIRPRL